MRLRAAVVAAVTVTALTAAPGGAAETRQAQLPYKIEDVNHHFGGPGAGAGVWDTEDSYNFPLQKGEKAVSVTISDERDGDVAAAVVQWTTDFESGGASVGHALTYHPFCTKTDAPVAVVPDVTVEIVLKKGTCEDGTPSTPVNGDIVVDFHRKA